MTSTRAIRQRAEASARRLGARRLDLYQVHWPNPLLHDQLLMRGMSSLQQAGLVSEVGVSSYPLDRWRATEDALSGRVLTNQVAYSLLIRSPEQDLLPFAESSGHVIIAFSPLAQGLLSGKYHQGNPPANRIRASSPLFRPENLERTNHLIATLREVADGHNATAAQIALAWAIHSPAVAAIPGASTVRQLESNVAAADIQLSDDEYQALTAAAPFRSAAAAPGTSRRRTFQRTLSDLKHTAVGGKRLAKTVRNERSRRRPR